MKTFSDLIYDYVPFMGFVLVLVSLCCVGIFAQNNKHEIFKTCLANGGTVESCAIVSGLR